VIIQYHFIMSVPMNNILSIFYHTECDHENTSKENLKIYTNRWTNTMIVFSLNFYISLWKSYVICFIYNNSVLSYLHHYRKLLFWYWHIQISARCCSCFKTCCSSILWDDLGYQWAWIRFKSISISKNNRTTRWTIRKIIIKRSS